MSQLPLRIDAVEVLQDTRGRYCLNDLHRAAGAEKRHQPSNFLQLGSSKELIQELLHTPPGIPGGPLCVVNGGPERGTYVVRELVYAYAMWVSAAFHLKVIRTFDAVARGAAAVPGLPRSYAEALFLAGQQAERIRALEQQLHRAPDPGVPRREPKRVRPQEHPWKPALSTWLAARPGVEEVSTGQLLEEALQLAPTSVRQGAVGRVMASMGWKRGRRRAAGALRWVYVRPGRV